MKVTVVVTMTVTITVFIKTQNKPDSLTLMILRKKTKKHKKPSYSTARSTLTSTPGLFHVDGDTPISFARQSLLGKFSLFVWIRTRTRSRINSVA
jgi:hypothetical protein